MLVKKWRSLSRYSTVWQTTKPHSRIPPKSPPHYDFPATKPSTCLTSTLVRLSFMSSGYHARQFRTQKQRLKQYVPAAGVPRIGNTFHQIVIAEFLLSDK
ncbi:hypothetical protein Bbelb_368600 [Branchiostoma belcheri]|nr:hypothetical protein Bbelb_368600 [Branchiostoma belcheri]